MKIKKPLRKLIGVILCAAMAASTIITGEAQIKAEADRRPYAHSPYEMKGTEIRSYRNKRSEGDNSSFDPRNYGLVTPVKNQENLGICWAFAGLSAYESFNLKMGLGMQDFSEEHMRWWAKNGDHDWNIGDEEGSSNDTAVGYLTSWSGPKMEADIPYNGKVTEKQGAKKPANYDSAPMYGYRVTDVINVAKDNQSIKEAIRKYGAVLSGYFESTLYKNEDATTSYCPKPLGQNHAIAIVGWDDNFPKEKIGGSVKPDENGAWLVKSSWGENINPEKGFVWVSYQDATIMAFSDNYAIANHIKYDGEKIYQHEYSYSSSIVSNRVLGANVFNFDQPNEVLKGVMFSTESINAGYRIFYLPWTSEGPTNKGRRLIAEGKVPYSGYITVNANDFALPEGKGAIAVEIDNTASGGKSTLSAEMNVKGFNTFIAKANKGESYIYQGDKYVDLNTIKKYTPANLVIKAITKGKEGGIKLLGSNRFQTAQRVSENGWSKSDNVVIVNSNAIIDALTSSPYATIKNAPILLTNKGSLGAVTKNELKRLGVKNVTIIGGESSVSGSVIDELAGIGISNVERISGENRFETSKRIAQRLIEISDKPIESVAVVNGYKGLSDAISFSPVSGERRIPILLCDNNARLNGGEEIALSQPIRQTYIIGGINSVSESLGNTLRNTVRISGSDRKGTNAQIIKNFYPDTEYEYAYVVKDGSQSPSNLIDGLAVGPLAAIKKSPVILSTWNLSDAQRNVLANKKFKTIVQVGGGNNSIAKTELLYMSGVK